jgi:hypothetical protein
MRLTELWSWLGGTRSRTGSGRSESRTSKARFRPLLSRLEDRTVPNGYLAIGAGPGQQPAVAIRVDIQDQLGGSPPNNLGSPPAARSDGKSDTTTQIFLAYNPLFRGGVHVATGNLDGLNSTPDQLITGPAGGGGPHIIVWNTQQTADGKIIATGIRQQFMAFDTRFTGGVNLTTGDFDGDGKAELVVAAGPGGGPHVKIYKTGADGLLHLANQFMAYDINFHGGVTVAANQGYTTAVQVRQVLSGLLPDNFVTTSNATRPVVTIPNQQGGTVDIPSVGSSFNATGNFAPIGGGGDAPLLPGSSAGFATGTSSDFTVPAGNPGTLDSQLRPLPYVTVGAGYLKYLSGDFLNSYNQIAFRPNDFTPPNQTVTNNVGNIVFLTYADTTAMSNYPAGTGIPAGNPTANIPAPTVGPFIQLGVTANGTAIVTPLKPGPAFNKTNEGGQLITGAGPGGGPHVRVWSFTGNGDTLINNGVQKQFMAFSPTFRGGVNVAFGSVVMSPLSPESDFPAPVISATGTFAPQPGGVFPGVYDYFPLPRPGTLLRPETTANTSPATSGLQHRPQFPFDPIRLRYYSSQIIVSMASGGSGVRVFSDDNPITFNNGAPSPSLRTDVSQVNLVPTFVDSLTVTDPTNPLNGFQSTSYSVDFQRSSSPQFNGGIQVFTSAFTFAGSANTFHIGTHTVGPPGNGFEVNPALGQTGTAPASHGVGPGSGDSMIRIFNQMSALDPLTSSQGSDAATYTPYDQFAPFTGLTNGMSVSFGFGQLNNPGLDIIELPAIAVNTVNNPIFVP